MNMLRKGFFNIDQSTIFYAATSGMVFGRKLKKMPVTVFYKNGTRLERVFTKNFLKVYLEVASLPEIELLENVDFTIF